MHENSVVHLDLKVRIQVSLDMKLLICMLINSGSDMQEDVLNRNRLHVYICIGHRKQ